MPNLEEKQTFYEKSFRKIWWYQKKAVPLQPLLRTKLFTIKDCSESKKLSGSYQSGQMGQTVNLLAMPSVVRIHHYPLFPKITQKYKSPIFERESDFFICSNPTHWERDTQTSYLHYFIIPHTILKNPKE